LQYVERPAARAGVRQPVRNRARSAPTPDVRRGARGRTVDCRGGAARLRRAVAAGGRSEFTFAAPVRK
jgi:hypothetical protein